MNKSFVRLQTRLMCRKARAVTFLEYTLLAAATLALAIVIRQFFGGAISDLVSRLTGSVEGTNTSF